MQNFKRLQNFNCNQIYQSYELDPKGEYIKRWIPELKNVPTKYIHMPWKMDYQMQQQFQVVIGQDYPFPIQIDQSIQDESEDVKSDIKGLFFEKKNYFKKKNKQQ